MARERCLSLYMLYIGGSAAQQRKGHRLTPDQVWLHCETNDAASRQVGITDNA